MLQFITDFHNYQSAIIFFLFHLLQFIFLLFLKSHRAINNSEVIYNSHPRVTLLCTLLAIPFFLSEQFFLNFFNLKRIIRTPKLCNKNIDHYARLRAILLSRTFSRDLKQSRLRDGPKQIVLHTALSTYLS